MGKDFDNGFGTGFILGTMMNSSGGGGTKRSGCYIATAVYGSYDSRKSGRCAGFAITDYGGRRPAVSSYDYTTRSARGWSEGSAVWTG